MNSVTNNICIVLVETSDPGNIGASARAMKTMGLTQLRLVNPIHFPHPKAIWRATHAKDVVENCQVYTSFADAVSDCQLVLATSARNRSLPWPMVTAKKTAELVTESSTSGNRVAIVFGRENSGLRNEELQMCHKHVSIEASPQFSVLNLSHAVQVICYEIYNYGLAKRDNSSTHFGVEWDRPLAQHQDVVAMIENLDKLLQDTQFYNRDNPQKLMPRLQRLFMRSGMDAMEVNILRGIIHHIIKVTGKGINEK